METPQASRSGATNTLAAAYAARQAPFNLGERNHVSCDTKARPGSWTCQASLSAQKMQAERRAAGAAQFATPKQRRIGARSVCSCACACGMLVAGRPVLAIVFAVDSRRMSRVLAHANEGDLGTVAQRQAPAPRLRGSARPK